VRELAETFCPREQHPDQWNGTQFLAESNAQFGIDIKAAGADPATLSHEQLPMRRPSRSETLRGKEKQFGGDLMRWLDGGLFSTWSIRSGKTICCRWTI